MVKKSKSRRGQRRRGQRPRCSTWYVPVKRSGLEGAWRVKCLCGWQSRQLPWSALSAEADAHQWAIIAGRDRLRPPWLR